jgi:hypothetical protein
VAICNCQQKRRQAELVFGIELDHATTGTRGSVVVVCHASQRPNECRCAGRLQSTDCHDAGLHLTGHGQRQQQSTNDIDGAGDACQMQRTSSIGIKQVWIGAGIDQTRCSVVGGGGAKSTQHQGRVAAQIAGIE